MVEISYKNDILHAANICLPWEKLDGCNILITGATGLIGSCIVEALMAHAPRNFDIYACGRNERRAKDRFQDYWNDSKFHFVQYDVASPLASSVDFHYVIHAASNASPNFFATKPVEVIFANILGVKNLMEYGLKHNMKRLLYVSSGEVYGEGNGDEFSEDYSGYVNPLLSRNCYPSSKRTAENLCVCYVEEYGVDCVIARPCHVYGPHFTESDNRVYAQFIRNVLDGNDIVMKSTGVQFRSWCYVVDCVSALLYILLKGENKEAYNVADEGSNISIKELADMVASIAGKKVVQDIPADSEKVGYNLVKKSVFKTERLRSLGWSVEGTMREKMEKTINELRNGK